MNRINLHRGRRVGAVRRFRVRRGSHRHRTAGSTFDPATLTINVGDTVTFVNGGGFHNVARIPVRSPISLRGRLRRRRRQRRCQQRSVVGQVVFPTAGRSPITARYMAARACQARSRSSAASVRRSSSRADCAERGGRRRRVDDRPVRDQQHRRCGSDLDGGYRDTDCATPETVPWLSLAPAAGTVPSVIRPEVDVTLDATTLTAGIYNANVCVHSNDATNDLVTVPVEFTVNTVDVIFVDGFDG